MIYRVTANLVNGWRVGLLMAVLLAPMDSQSAQVFRCERDGQVSFSDKACESGVKSIQKDYATSGMTGSLDMQVTLNHYSVEGQDSRSLMSSIARNGPNGYHGLARWRVNREFSFKRKLDGICRIETVKVTIVGDILMPKWIDMATAPRDLQRYWSSAYSTLLRHEDGHIQHGRELGLLVKEKLMGLGPTACDRIEGVAEAEYQRVYEQLKGRDAAYDLRTRHGTL